MAHAWKACWVQALGGSNPPSSAILTSQNAGPPDQGRARRSRQVSIPVSLAALSAPDQGAHPLRDVASNDPGHMLVPGGHRGRRAREIGGVVDELRAELRSGARRVGDPLLSERDLCERYGLTRYGARTALARLEAEGLIVAVHGRGRFVAGKP